jgi:single-strand DNA-binding protein
MSRGLNKVMIIGRLGRDPEMRYTPSGKPVTTFSMAVSRNWNTSEGERRSETEWFNVVAWGNLAEICKEYLTKGHQVYIEGRLQTRQWDDEKGGKRTSVEIVANEMIMLSERRDGNHEGNGNEIPTDDEEFPF